MSVEKSPIDEKMAMNIATRDNLLTQLKREVKQLMEEAVMKRFIHEEGGSVTSLCVSVEACLVHGLRKRIFGLFGTTSTFGLVHKISPLCPSAASIVKMVIQIEQKYWKVQKSSSLDKQSDGANNGLKSLPSSFRYLWIRLALFEKVLSTIVEYIADNSGKFYESEALMRDPVSASMVAALLVGPCALEYSKMKTLDHYWTDPPADELLQRHRIHSRSSVYSNEQVQTPRSPRLSIQVKRTESLGPDDMSQKVSSSAREYVMSLHQNAKANLLYGKNGVVVWPIGAKQPMKGYLSLHQNMNSTLTIKWTPNELMHGGSTDSVQPTEKGQLWRYAISLDVQDIVYLHCHQRGETEGSIVFVGADGIQYPPIEFPLGQHPLAFLSCLENGMLPWGQLDPPLWLHKGKGKIFPKLKRRSSSTDVNAPSTSDLDSPENRDYVFRVIPVTRPWSNDSSSSTALPSPKPPTTSVASMNIVPPPVSSRLVNLSTFSTRLKERLLSLSSSPANSPPATPRSRCSEQTSPTEERSPQLPRRNGLLNQHHQHHQEPPNHLHGPSVKHHPTELISQMSAPAVMDDEVQKSPSRYKLRTACDSMRHQILSRAFYGWLAHCRHMKTIRTHLVCLVNREIVPPSSEGLTEDAWLEFRSDVRAEDEKEFCRRVYFGNMPCTLRARAWPFLLGLFPWTSEEKEIGKIYDDLHAKYEGLLTEWTAAEAIVKERDKEAFKTARETNLAKRSIGISRQEPTPKMTAAVVPTTTTRETDQGGGGGIASPTGGDVTSLTMEPLGDELLDEPRDYLAHEWRQTISAINDMAAGSPTSPSTPEEGDGGLYSKELIDTFAMNLHRIEKDVHRCDRNHPYFASTNLDKLKNIMCTYVWENLHSGYVQGMCDLCAPLLVVFDDEVLAYACFCIQMKRLAANFPHGGGMDVHLANARALLQVLDPELFDLMHQNGDYTHFYFSYRWFLLDFKRELLYEDVYRVWEAIWASARVSSNNFVLFLVMATVELYRDIILDNNMDFTDVIKFFNEMAEKHDAAALLDLARSFVLRLQKAVEK